MKGVFGGAMLVAAVAAAVPVWAQSPMTPVRPLTAPGAARQSVEPPPAPGAAMPPSSVAADAATASEPAMPASQAEDRRRARAPERPARAGRDSTASRLNRQELGRIRSGAPYYPGDYRGYGYGYGYGPSPHSSSGD